MWVGTLELDLLLGDVHSLKEKRGIVRPVVAEIARTYGVSAAEVGHLDLYRRAEIGVAIVAGESSHCKEVLDKVERLVANRPEVEILSARTRLHSSDDD